VASRAFRGGRARAAAGATLALLCGVVALTPTPSVAAPSTGSTDLGAATVAALTPLYEGVREAAGYVVATQLEPGGRAVDGSASASWTPPADLRVPVLPPVTAAPPARELTKYEVLGAAYTSAAQKLSARCHLPYMLLAAINEVESSSLRGRRLDARHRVVPPVIGPALDGGRFAAIADTDGGRLDADPVWDRAVGPMQFIPATWRIWGADGNGDGVADPQNVDDATLAAGRYLCAGGRDLSRRSGMTAAILSYNHSQRYLTTVLGLYDAVTSGLVAGP
jgi:hypothetical protein